VASRVTFGVYEFDPETGELCRNGRPVRFQRQPALMLAALVAQPGEIVTREALQAAIWGADTHVDFERGLNFCAGQIRSALGDSAASPRFLETIPRRGYRFIAPVQSIQPSAAAEIVVPTPASRSWIGAFAVLAAIAVLAAVAVGWTMRRDDAPRIAVVPFDNETGSPDFDLASKNLSDATVARLATPERVPQLRVIGNAAALRFTFVPRDLQAMGESLGAGYIVLGQVKRDARRLRIVAHLIRVSDQTHVWAKTYDRDVLDLPAQSEIAEAIAAAVVTRITPR
jgi:TolB-like protein/DNA-binding winged helix-turn-helix (wHTH) protein